MKTFLTQQKELFHLSIIISLEKCFFFLFPEISTWNWLLLMNFWQQKTYLMGTSSIETCSFFNKSEIWNPTTATDNSQFFIYCKTNKIQCTINMFIIMESTNYISIWSFWFLPIPIPQILTLQSRINVHARLFFLQKNITLHALIRVLHD